MLPEVHRVCGVANEWAVRGMTQGTVRAEGYTICPNSISSSIEVGTRVARSGF